MTDITFANPELLLLLFVIPGLVVWYYYRLHAKESDVRFPTLLPFAMVKYSAKERLRHVPFILRMIALALVIIALARPQSTSKGQNVYSEGIDIVLALDISGSMLAEDFQPNRIEAAKNVAQDFIGGRTNDRIGLVIFSGESFTQCPLTVDYEVLKTLIKPLKSGMIEDGTAIGLGLANAVNRLRESKAKSKVIILLTDGVNNRGAIDPRTAAQAAASLGIRIYTIGVGSEGMAPVPVGRGVFGLRYENRKVEIDEPLLTDIAHGTNGRYFRARDGAALQRIYEQIDQLERVPVRSSRYVRYNELYVYPLALVLAALVLELALATWRGPLP
jgi:Ca-activated chloride channel family protein